jgi:hypothetical protein
VEEAVLVDESKALEYLEHDVADDRLGEVSLALLHHLVEVALHEFEGEKQLVLLADHLPITTTPQWQQRQSELSGKARNCIASRQRDSPL